MGKRQHRRSRPRWRRRSPSEADAKPRVVGGTSQTGAGLPPVTINGWQFTWGCGVIIVFTVLWLIPAWGEGTQKRRIYNDNWQRFPHLVQGIARDIPPFFGNLARVSCLFTQRVPAWSDWYLQVRFKRRVAWVTLDESDYSRLEPFGHHSRLDLMLSKSVPGNDSPQRRAMAEFVRGRYYALNPGSPPIAAVRFVRVVRRSNAELAAEAGPWRKRPLSDYTGREVIVDSTHTFE